MNVEQQKGRAHHGGDGRAEPVPHRIDGGKRLRHSTQNEP